METIQFLYFEGCPSWHSAWKNLDTALKQLNWKIKPEKIEIENDSQAQEYSFLGSPSIKYNGVDLWQETRGEYHMGCRVYQTSEGLRGAPTVEMLMDRLSMMRKNSDSAK